MVQPAGDLGLPVEPTATVAADPLIEAMVCELHTAALYTAVLASAVNAIGQAGGNSKPSELLAMMPNDSAFQLANTRWMLDAGVSPLVLLAVHDFMSELEPARAVMQRYAVDAAVLSLERAQVLHRLLLMDTWRRLARMAVEAIDRLDLDLAGRLPAFYSETTCKLRDLLLAAESGGSPCIGEGGILFVPALPQRRRSSRRTLLQNCMLTCRGRMHRAFVQNISSGGLGLSRAPVLIRDEPLSVELRNGRRFNGSVVWSSGSFAGMRFTVPLSQRDPILQG
jgi:hypothetical protein